MSLGRGSFLGTLAVWLKDTPAVRTGDGHPFR